MLVVQTLGFINLNYFVTKLLNLWQVQGIWSENAFEKYTYFTKIGCLCKRKLKKGEVYVDLLPILFDF